MSLTDGGKQRGSIRSMVAAMITTLPEAEACGRVAMWDCILREACYRFRGCWSADLSELHGFKVKWLTYHVKVGRERAV